MPTTFQLSAWEPAVTVTVAEDLNISGEAIINFQPFKSWLDSLEKNLSLQDTPGHAYESGPWKLTGVRIHTATFRSNGNIGYMIIIATLRREEGIPNQLERVIFLRGGLVGVFMILRPKDTRNERYIILTDKPRIGASSLTFLEIPDGLIGEDGLMGTAITEVEKQIGFEIRKEDLIDMTGLALGLTEQKEHLQPAIYPSAMNTDEFIRIFLWEKDLDRKEIEALKGKLTGERIEDSIIALRMCDYELWREGVRDAKTLAAWALYEGLNRAGKIEEKLGEIRMGKFKRKVW